MKTLLQYAEPIQFNVNRTTAESGNEFLCWQIISNVGINDAESFVVLVKVLLFLLLLFKKFAISYIFLRYFSDKTDQNGGRYPTLGA